MRMQSIEETSFVVQSQTGNSEKFADTMVAQALYGTKEELTRSSILANGYKSSSKLPLKHTAKSMPITQSEKSPLDGNLDECWNALTLLQAGEIAPVREWRMS